MTHDEWVNHVLAWTADYRMEIDRDGCWRDGLLEGLLLGAALALNHPEFLASLAVRACSSEDRDLEELPAGHSWQEHQDVVDVLVEECDVASCG